MKNIIKKIIFASCSLLLVLFFIPKEIDGQTTGSETPFGGMYLFTLDSSICTCSGNSHWILDYKSKSLLRLYYMEGFSKLYDENNLYGRYEVGTYSSFSMSCSIRVYTACVDLTNDGTYGNQPGTGTSN